MVTTVLLVIMINLQVVSIVLIAYSIGSSKDENHSIDVTINDSTPKKRPKDGDEIVEKRSYINLSSIPKKGTEKAPSGNEPEEPPIQKIAADMDMPPSYSEKPLDEHEKPLRRPIVIDDDDDDLDDWSGTQFDKPKPK